VEEVFRLRWLVKRLAVDKRTSEALIHQKSDVSDHLGLPAEVEIVKSGLEMLPKVIRDPAMEKVPPRPAECGDFSDRHLGSRTSTHGRCLTPTMANGSFHLGVPNSSMSWANCST
jgi:hypothetical protein